MALAIQSHALISIMGFNINILINITVIGIGHSNFFTLINIRCPPQQMNGLRQHRRCFIRETLRIPEAAIGARLIVVIPEQGVPAIAIRHATLPFIQQLLKLDKIKGHI